MKKFTLLLIVLMAYRASAQNTVNLLPVPQQVQIMDGRFALSANFTAAVDADPTDTILFKAVNRTYQVLNRRTGLVFGQQYITAATKIASPALLVTVKHKTAISMELDESYSLNVDAQHIVLTASNTIGALRGLETLLQLQGHDGSGYYIQTVNITDQPRFKWRGLMIDVARHFIPLDVLKRNIEAMAAVKLNVLHLHLTDDEGFRVESKLYPLLQKKGSNGDYYTQAELKGLVAFAAERGILIVPEFDMPGHSQSWFAGYPELASQPGPYRPGPRSQWEKEHPNPKAPKPASIIDAISNMVSPTFDASSEKVYSFIDRFMGEMAGIFPAPYVHIGADENNGMAWKNNKTITAFMKKEGIKNKDELQRYFVKRIYGILKKHRRQLIGWEEIYNGNLPKDAILQKWIPENNGMMKSFGTAESIASAGYKVIISEGFYLDIFMPAYIHYNNPGVPATDNKNIWGGEAAQWTEIANNENIEGRIWPRAAAIAERLWSPATVTDVDDLYRRLAVLSYNLDENGLQHKSNYERALRRLANNDDTGALKTLTDVLTPVKGYRKLMGVMFKPASAGYQTTPLTNVSDIVFVDSETKRKFRQQVTEYLATKNRVQYENIKACLSTWKQNDKALEKYFEGSPRLLEIQLHSKNLSAAATIGLEALEQIKRGDQPDAAWIKQKSDALSALDKPYGSTELSIIAEIGELVNGHTIPEPATFSAF